MRGSRAGRTMASMPYDAIWTWPASQASSTKQSTPPDQIGNDGVLTNPSPRISPSSPALRARCARSSATPRDEPNGDTPTWTPDDIAVTRLLPDNPERPQCGE